MSPGLTQRMGPESYLEARPYIFAIAYRMMGSVADAEDIVQEAFARVESSPPTEEVRSPKAYLAAVTTRIAIDHLRSARARRETYLGPWLPEPLMGAVEPSAEEQASLPESLSMAFLVLLESLSPVERAVFLLREVFEYEYEEIATVVNKSEDNCRQIAARAKQQIDARRPRFEASRARREELARRFFQACHAGDMPSLLTLLANDAAFYGDGGGKGRGLPKPLFGREAVARFFMGMFEKARQSSLVFELAEVNAQPGGVLRDPEGRLINVFSIDVLDGAVHTARSVINPDKLGHLGPLSDLGRAAR